MRSRFRQILKWCTAILVAVALCLFLEIKSHQRYLQFSRTDFQYRWYCARVVPFTSIRLSIFTDQELTGDGVYQEIYRPTNLRYLVDEGFLKVSNGFGSKWIFATMPAPGKGGQEDLDVLNRYFHDDKTIVNWTKKHPAEARRFWCLMQVHFDNNHEYHAQNLLMEAYEIMYYEEDIIPLLEKYGHICDVNARPDQNYQD